MSLPARSNAKRVDWWQIITDICRIGHTHASIGISIGAAKSTVNGWRNGDCEPRFEEGDRLIGLWCELMDRSRESVPRMR